MRDDHLRSPLEPTLAETGFTWFLRLVALACLIMGVVYWVRLIGYYPGSLWRFDLMPWQWQTACVSLAILFPVAAIGLWMMVSWGPVIWFVAAAVESLMFTVFAQYFASKPQVAIIHGATALIYIVLRTTIFLQRRRLNAPTSVSGR
ncbi:MAG: DUF6163 family protein [Phyllobacterium sp.]